MQEEEKTLKQIHIQGSPFAYWVTKNNTSAASLKDITWHNDFPGKLYVIFEININVIDNSVLAKRIWYCRTRL